MKPRRIYAFIATFFAMGFMLLILSNQRFDPRAFILERPPEVPPGQSWGIGYDAQFYYLIATDPIGSFEKMDHVTTRYQRIFFPLLVRILSFGNSDLIPWTMLGINLLAVWIGVSSLAALIGSRDGKSWVAVIWILNIGYLLSLRLDLLEPLSLALALWGWWRWEDGKIKSAVLLFALAGLTKEVGLVIPAAIAGWQWINRRWKKGGMLFAGIGFPYIAWRFLLEYFIARAGLPRVTGLEISFPFSGIAANQGTASLLLMALWVIFPLVLASLLAVKDGFKMGWRSRAGLDSLTVLAHLLFISILPHSTWFDPIAFFRTAAGAVAVVLLWSAAYHQRLLPGLIGLWIPSGAVLFFFGVV